jgi:hypothetical protein
LTQERAFERNGRMEERVAEHAELVDLGFRSADGKLVSFTYDDELRLTVDEVDGRRVVIVFEDAAYLAWIAIDEWPGARGEHEDKTYEIRNSQRVRELAAEDDIYAAYRHWRIHFNGFETFEVVASGIRVDGSPVSPVAVALPRASSSGRGWIRRRRRNGDH